MQCRDCRALQAPEGDARTAQPAGSTRAHPLSSPFMRHSLTWRSSAPDTMRGSEGWKDAQFTPRSWPCGVSGWHGGCYGRLRVTQHCSCSSTASARRAVRSDQVLRGQLPTKGAVPHLQHVLHHRVTAAKQVGVHLGKEQTVRWWWRSAACYPGPSSTPSALVTDTDKVSNPT